MSYLGQGDAPKAERLLREQLAVYPADVESMRVLALLVQSQGRSDEAIGVLQSALTVDPVNAHVHADLGALYRTLKRPQDAAAALRRALQLEPASSAAWRLLGDVLVDSSEPAAALAAYGRSAATDRFREALATAGAHLARQELQPADQVFREILKREAGHVGALCGLAAIALLGKQWQQAERLFRNALRQSAHLPWIWRGLAQALLEAGQLEEAEAAVRHALLVEPAAANNWVTLGTVLARRFRQPEALAAYDESLRLNPHQPRVLMSKGHLLKTLGRRAECEAAYLQSIELDPANGEFYWGLADLKNYLFSDAQIEQMQAALAATTDAHNAALFNFAIGRAREQRAQFPTAFAHYAAANAARRRGVVFDAAGFDAKSRRIMEFFGAARFVLQPPQLGESAVQRGPIFIVGLPRSGSTLVDQILASHSQVEGTMELPNIVTMVRELDEAGGRNDAYPESLADVSPANLRMLGARYLKETQPLRTGRPYFIDKMPNNFRHIGLIELILPGAVLIDVRRQPMDACFSAFKQYFAEGQTFSYDLEDLGRYYRSYLAVMDHWQAVLPGRVLTLSYESLVRNTEYEVRRLLAHCGLEFEPACLRFHETQRAVRTASSEQVRQPMYDSGVGYWRHFEKELAPLARALGDSLERFES